MASLRVLGFLWGIGGVIALLLLAVFRLAPMAFALGDVDLNFWHWLALCFSVIYMAYAEGYHGFYKGFAPRVVARANYLRMNPMPWHVALAPLFCMGYFHTTRRRMLTSYGLTIGIIGLVILVRWLPQPWRGIVDAGVVVGLFLGVCSILFFLVQSLTSPERLTLSAEIPAKPVLSVSD